MQITIIERKLGREKAMGQAYKDDGLIEIDPRQSAQDYLETVVHEVMHVVFPAMSEDDVTNSSKIIGQALWEVGYRKCCL